MEIVKIMNGYLVINNIGDGQEIWYATDKNMAMNQWNAMQEASERPTPLSPPTIPEQPSTPEKGPLEMDL